MINFIKGLIMIATAIGFAFLPIIGVSALVLGALAGVNWVIWKLWNGIMPIFWHTAPHLTFLQTWGAWILLVLILNAFRIVRTKTSD